MRHSARDAETCRSILREVRDVYAFLSELTEPEFLRSRLHQKAVVMSLLNIGELSKAFTEDFLLDTCDVPWQDIRSARNLAAHTYEAIDMRDVWETYRADLPALQLELKSALERVTANRAGNEGKNDHGK